MYDILGWKTWKLRGFLGWWSSTWDHIDFNSWDPKLWIDSIRNHIRMVFSRKEERDHRILSMNRWIELCSYEEMGIFGSIAFLTTFLWNRGGFASLSWPKQLPIILSSHILAAQKNWRHPDVSPPNCKLLIYVILCPSLTAESLSCYLSVKWPARLEEDYQEDYPTLEVVWINPLSNMDHWVK